MFFTLFLDSFYQAHAIYFFSYLLTPLDLVLGFYLFLASGVFLLFTNKPHFFQEKQTFYEQSALHLLVTFSLVALGQYTFCLIFQFYSLLLFFDFKQKKIANFLLFFYLFFIHYALLLVFTSDFFVLYFVNLFAIVLFLLRKKRKFLKLEFLVCGICMAFFAFMFHFFDVFIYDIYVWLDVLDASTFIDETVLYTLTFLHVFLLIALSFKQLLGYNKKNYLGF